MSAGPKESGDLFMLLAIVVVIAILVAGTWFLASQLSKEVPPRPPTPK